MTTPSARLAAAVLGCTVLGVLLPVPSAAQGDVVLPPAAVGSVGSAGGLFRSIDVSAFVDGYTSLKLDPSGEPRARLRAFDTTQGLELSYAEVALERKPVSGGRIGFRIDLGAGKTADAVGAAEPSSARDTLRYVQQGYVSFLAPLGHGLQIDGGKFVTPHGAEVIEARDNWNYTRGLLFGWAVPYYHFGVRARYAVNDQVVLGAQVVNGWNDVRDNNGAKTVGLSLNLAPTKSLSVVANFMRGPEQAGNDRDARSLLDAVVTWNVKPDLALMANLDLGRDARSVLGEPAARWWGIAAYARWTYVPRFALVARGEWLDDRDGWMTGSRQALKSLTLTHEFPVLPGEVVRLEVRRDWSSASTFESRGRSSGDQLTVTIGLSLDLAQLWKTAR